MDIRPLKSKIEYLGQITHHILGTPGPRRLKNVLVHSELICCCFDDVSILISVLSTLFDVNAEGTTVFFLPVYKVLTALMYLLYLSVYVLSRLNQNPDTDKNWQTYQEFTFTDISSWEKQVSMVNVGGWLSIRREPAFWFGEQSQEQGELELISVDWQEAGASAAQHMMIEEYPGKQR